MTRRKFSIALAGCSAAPALIFGGVSPVIILQAIAGAHLPHTLAITSDFPEKFRRGLWELRTYRRVGLELAAYVTTVFPRAGIHPVLRETTSRDLAYLIPFEDLTARDRAWTAVNADPRWIRACTQFQSYGFGLYRAL
jgi:hypothetical protein